MSKAEVKLQNIVFPMKVDEEYVFPELLCWRDHIDTIFCNDSLLIKAGGRACFATYFNVLSVLHWNEYSVAKAYKLNLEVKGDAIVQLIGLDKIDKQYYDDSFFEVLLEEQIVRNPEREKIEISIPKTAYGLIGFTIEAIGECELFGGYYSAEVDSEDIQDIRIVISTTTFKKEQFVRENAKLIKKYVLESDNDLKDKIWLNIVDNGRTLSPNEFDSEKVKLYHNPNTGGSGGYARGMLEAINMPQAPTHMILMDDDVLVLPESFFRTYYLLRILKQEYKNAFVSGAMFDYNKRELLYEDIGNIIPKEGAFGSTKYKNYREKEYVKGRRFELDMSKPADFVIEQKMTFTCRSKYKYAGWWYCCIPTDAIRNNGLPLPLFVRGDDVEFSLRNHAKLIAMNGISIWHMGFTEKFNAAMELYQVHRNSLVIRAASGVANRSRFFFRIFRYYYKELTRFEYNNCNQLLDAIDGFLAGPDFLEANDGEGIIKAHNAKNDKLVPINDLSDDDVLLGIDPKGHEKCTFLERIWYLTTLNGHRFSRSSTLLEEAAVVSNGWEFCLKRNCRRKKLLSVNTNTSTGLWLIRDEKRYHELQKRAHRTFLNYILHYNKVKSKYRKRCDIWKSEEFWRRFLNI